MSIDDSAGGAPLESVCSLVDGLARLKVDKPGQPLGICFEVLPCDGRPPAVLADGGTEA